MRIEIPFVEIFGKRKGIDKVTDEIDKNETKGIKEKMMKVYVSINGNYFKKQYEFLEKEYVLRCKFLKNKGFIIINEKDFEKLKKERINIIDYELIDSY